MNILPPKKIKIVTIKGKGLGIIAIENILAGELIEVCPVIYLSEEEKNLVKTKSVTLHYYYLHKRKTNQICIMLGYGSLYNHSAEANADFIYDDDDNIPTRIVEIRAIKDINKNEEIVIDYEFDDDKVEFLDLK